MELLEAIAGRRAIRSFLSAPVSDASIRQIIDAAVLAPSALNSQPWLFAIISGRSRLEDYSERAKAHYLATFSPGRDPHAIRHDELNATGFDLFYGAPSLIVVYCLPAGQFSVGDCCFAALNLMLVAHGLGLGTCPIGYAQSWFDLSEVKQTLSVPSECTAVVPIAVGWPAAIPPPTTRRAPIIRW